MKPFLKKITWWLFAFFSIVIGLYPLLYFLNGRHFGIFNSKAPEQLNSLFWNSNFYTHIALGGIALAIGWIQFNQKIRDKNRKLHKRIGMAYVTAAFFSSISGIYVAIYTAGGMIASWGFIALGITWLVTSLMGWKTAKSKNFESHEDWMVFSYAACFAAVTLRVYLPILEYTLGDFITAYRIVAWLCWVPNMLIAFWIVRNRKKTAHSLE